MKKVTVIKHILGAPLLKTFGLGPYMMPAKALHQLKKLLQNNSFWAIDREINDLKRMLSHSNCIITLWKNRKLVGFGRATSDWTYRAVLWDVIIDKDYQKLGLGKLLINELLESNAIKNVEKVYLMTTNCREFYKNNGFKEVTNQSLLIKSSSQK